MRKFLKIIPNSKIIIGFNPKKKNNVNNIKKLNSKY